MRIALCGGTFDPFHLGHLRAPASVREEFGWQRIIFIPAWKQPFKLDRATASSADRFTMAGLSTLHVEEALVSPIELDRGAVSYTVDTLRSFRSDHPEATIDWVIGDDNLSLLPEWKAIDEIFTLANIVVLQRGEAAVVPSSLRSRLLDGAQRGPSGSLCIATNVRYAVSATEVRERLKRGESVAELVHPDVVHYIHKNRLYSTTEAMN